MFVGSLLLWIKLLWNNFRVETFCIFSFIDFLTANLLLWPGALLAVVQFFFFLFTYLNSMVKHSEAVDSYYCCVTVTLFWQIQKTLSSQLLVKSYLSLSLILVLRQEHSWRESACQGESMLHGKNSPGITPHLQHYGSGTRQGKLGRWNSEEVILI